MKERCSSCKYFEIGDGDTGAGLCRASVPEVQYVSVDPNSGPGSMVLARWPVVFADIDWCGAHDCLLKSVAPTKVVRHPA